MSAAAEFEFKHGTMQLDDVRLHYVTSGQGDLLVLLHGYPQTWYEWRQLIPPLAAEYTVIVPDMRGLGDSTKPATGYDKKTVAADIYGLVSELGYDSVRLIGHDLGGAVAYAYATMYREEVSHLAVIEQVLPGFGLEDQMDASEGGFWPLSFHMVRDVPEMLTEGRERKYLQHFFNIFVYNTAAITEADLDEYVRTYSAPGGMRAGFEYYRTLLQDAEDNRELAEDELGVPVLALGGSHAQSRAVAESLERVAADVDGNRYLDYVMGYGPLLLGHDLPEIVQEAVAAAVSDGPMYGVPTELEVELREFVIDHVGSVEMLQFVNSGTEATAAAVRLARGTSAGTRWS